MNEGIGNERPKRRDAYEVLGVGADATEAEIKARFKELAWKEHPDRGGSIGSMQELSNARDELLDPEKRSKIDNEREIRARTELLRRAAGTRGNTPTRGSGPSLNEMFKSVHNPSPSRQWSGDPYQKDMERDPARETDDRINGLTGNNPFEK